MNSFYRNTWAEIDLEAVSHNVNCLKEWLPKGKQIMAVVKANGYGHGDIEVAKEAIGAGATFLGVALLDEGIKLRANGIKVPILVLGDVPPSYVDIAAEYDISLTLHNESWLREASKYDIKKPLSLHMKIDTGMNRIGFKDKDVMERVVSKVKQSSHFVLEGLFTHFATADELHSEYYEEQSKCFVETVYYLKSKGICPPNVHCANSASTLRLPHDCFTMVRFGISMYGLSPSSEMKKVLPFTLKPVLSLYTSLIHVKSLEEGESISYGATYTTKKEEWIGTVPIGYADGWLRGLQGFTALMNGEEVQNVGRICMDQLMFKLPKDAAVGTKVTLIGHDGGKSISADDIASYLNTINYEVTCMISDRVPRVYKRADKVVKVINNVLA
ncbi:alanine racemase [Priestia filamentosa]|uniref:alanine racemase n=1 Tax=Priestia filamentosa TaxID=1402861 RepID=UPI001C1E7FA9|nr:alanine racemase [Priestia filamentosa]WCM16061.1 alanine racemase [Priestia filamentosa]